MRYVIIAVALQACSTTGLDVNENVDWTSEQAGASAPIEITAEPQGAGSFAPELGTEIQSDASVPVVQSEAPETPSDGKVATGDSPLGRAILYRAEPSWSCSNRDMVITLRGGMIHWNSIVKMVYPYSGAALEITHNDADACGKSPIRWKDIGELAFVTRQYLNWDGMTDYVSGYYLVSVIGPAGESNQVGMNLQWCDDAEAAMAGVEIGDCW